MCAICTSLTISHVLEAESFSLVSNPVPLAWWTSTDVTLSSLRDLGPHWTGTHIFSRAYLRRPSLLLHPRRHRSHRHLPRDQEVAQITSAFPHCADHLRRRRVYPASDTAQLPLLGHRRMGVPVPRQAATLQLVESVELPDVVGIGPGAGARYALHLLRVYDE